MPNNPQLANEIAESGTPALDPIALIASALHIVLGLLIIHQGASLWLDEHMGLAVVTSSWPEARRFFQSLPEQHPLHYALLWIWVQAGQSEVWLRLHSLLLSAISVLIIASLARVALKSPRSAHAVAWTYAVSPFALTFATEARMYSLLILLSAATCLLLLRALRVGGRRTWVAYTVVAVLTAYTHFFGVLLVLAIGLATIWVNRRDRATMRSLVIVHGLTAVLFLPWLVLIMSGGPTGGQEWKGITHLLLSAPYTAVRFTVGYGAFPVYYGWQEAVLSDFREHLPLLLLSGAGFTLALGLCLGLLTSGDRAEPRDVPWVIGGALLGPMLLSFLLAPVVVLAGDRYFAVSFPAFIVATWAGISWASGSGHHILRNLGRGAAVLVVGATVWATTSQIARESSPGTEWSAVGSYLQQAPGPVAVHPGHIRGIAEHYLAGNHEPIPVLPAAELSGSVLEDLAKDGLWLVISHSDESGFDLVEGISSAANAVLCESFSRGAGIRVYRVSLLGYEREEQCPFRRG